jgi:hypothetical protein
VYRAALRESARRSTEGGNVPIYEIRVKGHLDRRWSDWFDGLEVNNLESGEALLCGHVVDQAALHGVLNKVRDLGLPLLAVRDVGPAGGEPVARTPMTR